MAWASLACTRASESSGPPPAGRGANAVDDDVKDVAKATKKAAQDVGHATVDLAVQVGKGLEQATDKAGGSGQDAWTTTKVKSELASEGFDPVHVHVDTDGRVVTLSGTVDSGAKAQRAANVAKSIKGVVAVKNHLFVKPSGH